MNCKWINIICSDIKSCRNSIEICNDLHSAITEKYTYPILDLGNVLNSEEELA